MEFINFSSNDYLGLASHPEIVSAAKNAMEEFGFGGGASRLLSGGSILHRELEEKIAHFKGTDAALVFNSGYSANTGTIPSIAGEGDIIFSDELNHASIVDGCRLSRARTVIYKHRDVEHLSYLMEKEEGEKRIVITDSVFSMDGDIAPLREIYDICLMLNSELRTPNSVLLFIDDAHGTGVLGRGKGALADFDICPEPWIIQMGTFSKALGSFGAFVAGSRDVVDWLINTARSFFFSTALPACVAAASARAIELIEERPELIEKLWETRDRLVTGLRDKGFDISNSETPIIPLKTKSNEDALKLSQYLYEKGIYAPAIRPPAVKTPRVRIT
ncbi:MAG TPA: aminotransferase class I/II-fold pyridoxal phosphate-dependent enzyme, partial [Thermodesulfovibrionales bacterium]|nr:aminotransferase class I/II-fold pyridoxal phosphate-dependent enzyme [Thermodesulfovibrionales bacterium]